MRITTERDAKEYLIARIVAEAQAQGIALTDIERKMLYFTESGWTLPHMLEVNAQFERDYDNAQYERKILGLASAIEKHNETVGGDDQEAWDEAIEKLREGDHYLLVLIDPKLVGNAKGRPPGDIRRLILTALACSVGLFVVMVLYAAFSK